MDAEVRDAIQGHAPRTAGEEYGVFDDVMYAELLKLRRYEVTPGGLRDGRRRGRRKSDLPARRVKDSDGGRRSKNAILH